MDIFAETPSQLHGATRARLTAKRTVEVIGAHESAALPAQRTVPVLGYAWQFVVTSLPLVVADMLVLSASLAIVGSILDLVWPVHSTLWASYIPVVAAALGLSQLFFGLYPGAGLTPHLELRQMSQATSLALAIVVAVAIGEGANLVVIGMLLVTWLALLVLLPCARGLARAQLGRFRWWGLPTVIFGTGPAADAVYRRMRAHTSQGLRPLGCVDEPHRVWQESDDSVAPFLGTLEEANVIAAKGRAFWAIVVMPDRDRAEVTHIVNQYTANIPHVLVSAETPIRMPLWSRTHECGGEVCLYLKQRLQLPLPRLLKRSLDLTAAIGIIILGSPILAALAILTRLSSPGPIFYSQQRLGRGGRTFQAWKFRTMVQNADQVLQGYLDRHPELRQEWERDHKLKSDPRVTRIGKIMRRTSLDELPQIWNVLRGEMSLVGPRPIVKAEIEKYDEVYGDYSRVVPGVTGLWQINGRNNTTYAERVAYDAYYVRHWTPWLDLHILLRTVKVVLLREGAY